MHVLDAQQAAAVSIDHATLRAQAEGDHTRYTVALTGRVDPHWVAAYRAVQAESTSYRRFRLDPATGTISFAVRMVDGPAQVFEVLERLEALIEIVNRSVPRSARRAAATALRATSRNPTPRASFSTASRRARPATVLPEASSISPSASAA
jgi:hypothetical protein